LGGLNCPTNRSGLSQQARPGARCETQAHRWNTQICYAAQEYYTRNSANADKPRDAFRGQSRSPNMVPCDMLGMVS